MKQVNSGRWRISNKPSYGQQADDLPRLEGSTDAAYRVCWYSRFFTRLCPGFAGGYLLFAIPAAGSGRRSALRQGAAEPGPRLSRPGWSAGARRKREEPGRRKKGAPARPPGKGGTGGGALKGGLQRGCVCPGSRFRLRGAGAGNRRPCRRPPAGQSARQAPAPPAARWTRTAPGRWRRSGKPAAPAASARPGN